jgi:hypothetical protein
MREVPDNQSFMRLIESEAVLICSQRAEQEAHVVIALAETADLKEEIEQSLDSLQRSQYTALVIKFPGFPDSRHFTKIRDDLI